MKIVYTKEEVEAIIAREVQSLTNSIVTVKFRTYSNEEFVEASVQIEETKASDEPSE